MQWLLMEYLLIPDDDLLDPRKLNVQAMPHDKIVACAFTLSWW